MAGQSVSDLAATGRRVHGSRRRRDLAKGQLAALLVALGAAATSAGAGSDPSPAEGTRPAVSVEQGSARFGKSMPAQDRWHLGLAFAVALERVRSNGGCGALFDELRTDAVSALLRTVYHPVQTHSDMALCRRGVIAVTEVNGSRTRICPNIRRVSRPLLASILIHEALHHAGMSEAPFDPLAPTSAEITRRVKVSCAF
jgi:hypothetical protein